MATSIIPALNVTANARPGPSENEHPKLAAAKNEEITMSQTTEEKNKELLLDAFDTSSNKRDYSAAGRNDAQKA